MTAPDFDAEPEWWELTYYVKMPPGSTTDEAVAAKADEPDHAKRMLARGMWVDSPFMDGTVAHGEVVAVKRIAVVDNHGTRQEWHVDKDRVIKSPHQGPCDSPCGVDGCRGGGS